MTVIAKKHPPIRPGDEFYLGKYIWRVLRHIPGGRLDMFCRERTMFGWFTVKEVRNWKRVK